MTWFQKTMLTLATALILTRIMWPVRLFDTTGCHVLEVGCGFTRVDAGATLLHIVGIAVLASTVALLCRLPTGGWRLPSWRLARPSIKMEPVGKDAGGFQTNSPLLGAYLEFAWLMFTPAIWLLLILPLRVVALVPKFSGLREIANEISEHGTHPAWSGKRDRS